MRRLSIIALFASALVLLTACGGEAADDGPMPTSASATARPTIVSPEERNNQAAGAGNYVLTAATLEDPAKPSATYKQKMANSRLIAVQVNFENAKGTAAMDVNPGNLKLIDSGGLIYEPYIGAHADEVKAAKLKQGEKATGWVAFEIPKDAKPAKVRYTVGLLTTVQLEADIPAS